MGKIYRILRTGFWAVAALCLSGVQVSCDSDDIKVDAMYTFTGETVASFCQNTPELTDFYKLITKCGADALLEVYGHYTCFVPSNEALEIYLEEKGKTLDELTEEEAQKVVYNCVIRGNAEYTSQEFIAGSLSTMTLAERYLVLSFTNDEEGRRVIWVNDDSRVTTLDQEVHNGVVHVVDKVIEPSEMSLLEVLQNDDTFKIWAMAYEASGWYKEMEKLYDESYVNTFAADKVELSGYTMKTMPSLRYGYTLFCEPDELLRENGITGNTREEILASLEQYARTYYGSEDLGNYESKNNPLNRFVAYHMLNRQMATNNMVFDTPAECIAQGAEGYWAEYYETMYTYRIMEIKIGNKINLQKNGHYVGIDETHSNIDAVNGFVHTITDMLVYDEEVMSDDVLHKRLRFDAMSIPPQLTNNNIRWNNVDIPDANGYTVTPDYCGEYFTYNEASNCLMWGSRGWASYQVDEINMKEGYDFTIRLLPVPPGNWEIRIGYNAESWRGMGQIFIDGNLAGTPVDLKIGDIEGDPRCGWVADSETSDGGIEVDKMMRNLGYMKGPASCFLLNGNMLLRDFYKSLRYIVGQYRFTEYGAHTLRARSVDFAGREFSIDYFELVPVDVIRNEDIY